MVVYDYAVALLMQLWIPQHLPAAASMLCKLKTQPYRTYQVEQGTWIAVKVEPQPKPEHCKEIENNKIFSGIIGSSDSDKGKKQCHDHSDDKDGYAKLLPERKALYSERCRPCCKESHGGKEQESTPVVILPEE